MRISVPNKACVALLLLIASDPIASQEALSAQATDGCPLPSPETSAALRDMRQTMLTPGSRIDFAKMATSPGLQAARKEEEARRVTDWANLCRYRTDNAASAKGSRPILVFVGASITENWRDGDPGLFQDGVVNRGIGGQTTAQLLLRFYQDVVKLRPRIVHIMGGANDIAGNSGRLSDDDYKNNIQAMVDIAQANGITVIIGSIPPTSRIPWQASLTPAPRIVVLNSWLKNYAAQHRVVFADYAKVLADEKGGLPALLSGDGVHPNRTGYGLMRPVIDVAIAKAELQITDLKE